MSEHLIIENRVYGIELKVKFEFVNSEILFENFYKRLIEFSEEHFNLIGLEKGKNKVYKKMRVKE